MPKTYPKHVFCIEGNWEEKLSRYATVKPVLELLKINAGIKFIYRDCSTKAEMLYLIEKWQQQAYADYRILYLAFHGRPGELIIDKNTTVSLVELGDIINLSRRRHRRLVYFGACSFLKGHKRPIKSFLEKSGTRAVCGYETDVEWMKSAALDLIAINELQRFSMTHRGLTAAERSILESTRALAGRLGFRMVYI
jgi:hypothetical protein